MSNTFHVLRDFGNLLEGIRKISELKFYLLLLKITQFTEFSHKNFHKVNMLAMKK